MKSRGVEFTSGITDQGWGLLTHIRMPGGMDMELYEPKYAKRAQRTRRKGTRRAGAKR